MKVAFLTLIFGAINCYGDEHNQWAVVHWNPNNFAKWNKRGEKQFEAKQDEDMLYENYAEVMRIMQFYKYL